VTDWEDPCELGAKPTQQESVGPSGGERADCGAKPTQQESVGPSGSVHTRFGTVLDLARFLHTD